jgi:hydroxymethylglutaryl-CoA synthase
MPDTRIIAAAGYLPLLRFDRGIARKELRWSGLGAGGNGHRAVAGWDEDALTLAVEAARGLGPVAPDRITFASTSAPFIDRAQAALVAEALGLPDQVSTLDVAGNRRAGVGALVRALESGATDLIAAGEKRLAQPGSAQHLAWGDGAGAVLVGPGAGVARLLARATVNLDLLDIVTTTARGLPYAAEDRFVRDTAVDAVYAPAIRQALASADLAAERVTWAVVPEPVTGTWKALMRPCGLACANLAEEICRKAGDLGAALPLFGLALALERAAPGDVILLAGFGNGADVLLLEVTAHTLTRSATDALAQGLALTSYSRFLSLTGALTLDWGPRSEVNQKVTASTLARHGRAMHGFVGGRDAGGNVQFPQTLIPVRPDATGPEPMTPVRLADEPAQLLSVTADRLNFTPDPPFVFGLVQFDNGARVAMELCDTEAAPPVGAPLRMRFRIKTIDRQRNFPTYFWKAAPVVRPPLNAEKP